MSLNKWSLSRLNKELKSCTDVIQLIDLIKKVNNFNIKKTFKLILVFLLSIIISFLLCKINKFDLIIDSLTNMGLTVSIGLVALIIAGYSIVTGTLSKDNVYFLLLTQENYDGAKSLSLYTSTIIKCTEPLLWFTLLLGVSISFKILYLLKDIFHFQYNFEFFLKTFSISILIYLILISIISLVYFILNIYNLLVANARFELLQRHAKNKNSSIEEIIKYYEDELNKSTPET